MSSCIGWNVCIMCSEIFILWFARNHIFVLLGETVTGKGFLHLVWGSASADTLSGILCLVLAVYGTDTDAPQALAWHERLWHRTPEDRIVSVSVENSSEALFGIVFLALSGVPKLNRTLTSEFTASYKRATEKKKGWGTFYFWLLILLNKKRNEKKPPCHVGVNKEFHSKVFFLLQVPQMEPVALIILKQNKKNFNDPEEFV